jgi:hypothetical protein
LHMHIMLLQMFRRALILSRPVVPSLSVFVIAAQFMWHMSCSGCLTVSAAKSLSFLLSIFSFFCHCVLSWTTQHCLALPLALSAIRQVIFVADVLLRIHVCVFCLGQHSTVVQSFCFCSPSIGLNMSAANVPCATQHCEAVLAFGSHSIGLIMSVSNVPLRIHYVIKTAPEHCT